MKIILTCAVVPGETFRDRPRVYDSFKKLSEVKLCVRWSRGDLISLHTLTHHIRCTGKMASVGMRSGVCRVALERTSVNWIWLKMTASDMYIASRSGRRVPAPVEQTAVSCCCNYGLGLILFLVGLRKNECWINFF